MIVVHVLIALMRRLPFLACLLTLGVAGRARLLELFLLRLLSVL